MGFRRSLVRIQSPRLEGRLSPDDSRPFPLTESSLAATVSRGSFVNNRTGIDGTCTRLSAVGATVGATIRAAPFVPVARTDSPSACPLQGGAAAGGPRLPAPPGNLGRG